MTLLLKPPRLMEMEKGSIGIQSVELGREGVRKWKLFLHISFCTLIFGKEYSFILLHRLCVRVVKQEGDGRRTKEQRGEVQIQDDTKLASILYYLRDCREKRQEHVGMILQKLSL